MPCEPSVAGVRLDEAGVAGERRAVVVGLGEVGVEALGEGLRRMDTGSRTSPLRRSTPGRPLLAVASAVQNSAASGVIRMPSPASLISLASSFLPSHSGVRPTISPPMNTASRTYSRIEYRPVPTPPKITSLADRLAKGTAPPMPVKDSIALLTAPHEVTVVIDVEQRRAGDPEALLLAFQVAAGRSPRSRACAGRRRAGPASRAPRRCRRRTPRRGT